MRNYNFLATNQVINKFNNEPTVPNQPTGPFENIFFSRKVCRFLLGFVVVALKTKLGIMLKLIFGKSNVDYLVNVTSH